MPLDAAGELRRISDDDLRGILASLLLGLLSGGTFGIPMVFLVLPCHVVA
jgi:hypothetical protein